MKSFIKISLIAVLLFNTAGLFASEGDFSFSLKRVEEKSVTFFISETQAINVSIFGADNEVIYEQEINAVKGTTKTYDLNSLPNGSYRFQLTTNSVTAEYKIQLNGGKADVSEPLITNVIQPVLTTTENGIVTLSFENAPEGPLEVEILDGYNNVVYSKMFDAEAKFVKKFDVMPLALRAMTFVVKSGNKVFAKAVQM